MAIKNKKRRSKSKQAARAPRHEPVQVPTPFFNRRWVQLIAAALVGLFAMMLFVWFSNGLRSNDAESKAADAAAAKRKAATGYQDVVDGAFGTIGVVNPGITPTVFPDMLAALQKMQQGTTPDDAASAFDDAAAGAADATKTIVRFNVADAIRDEGFDSTEATVFTSSAQQLSLALGQFQHCAEVGGDATAAIGPRADDLITIAQGLCDAAQAQLSQAWSDYQAALAAAGIVVAPGGGGQIPGLDGVG